MAGTLKELKDEGKIRAIGASNLSFRQLQEFNADGYLEVFQSEYSLIQREAEHDLLPYCEKNGISFIPYFPLASGLLTESLQKTQSLRTAERTGRFREKLFTKTWSEWISFVVAEEKGRRQRISHSHGFCRSRRWMRSFPEPNAPTS